MPDDDRRSTEADDRAYWRRRADQHEAMAARAAAPEVAAVHRAIAEAYGTRADAASAPNPNLPSGRDGDGPQKV